MKRKKVVTKKEYILKKVLLKVVRWILIIAGIKILLSTINYLKVKYPFLEILIDFSIFVIIYLVIMCFVFMQKNKSRNKYSQYKKKR